ncbi:hypothetical protein [Oceanobacillus halophilus]|uniref:Replicative helicase inhibitor G39P N-terminal domain-containing protein n=1 Tax=Oceanobacillus halophilus TaxID=930130 RepID=A0A494ZUL5_9BACI|nr:hypothetical protein [Oceanobacillus halophilus]RKQ30015.1 hypothetical protein D8M06_16750 [Oceanobacillus halophilus]
MTREEAIQVLKTIENFYPKYKLTNEKASLLIPFLLPMDYQGVLYKLSQFVAAHAFAPTLAEIAVYPKVPNTYLDNLKKWEEEASQVPLETKRKFNQQLERLLKEKAYHEHS